MHRGTRTLAVLGTALAAVAIGAAALVATADRGPERPKPTPPASELVASADAIVVGRVQSVRNAVVGELRERDAVSRPVVEATLALDEVIRHDGRAAESLVAVSYETDPAFWRAGQSLLLFLRHNPMLPPGRSLVVVDGGRVPLRDGHPEATFTLDEVRALAGPAGPGAAAPAVPELKVGR